MNEMINTTEISESKSLVSSCWKGLALFLLGIVVGFLFAPIKKGINICNNNGNKNKLDGNSATINSEDNDNK